MSLAFPPDTDTPGYEAEMCSKVGVGVGVIGVGVLVLLVLGCWCYWVLVLLVLGCWCYWCCEVYSNLQSSQHV